MFSAPAAVCTVWLRHRNWLNYITLHYPNHLLYIQPSFKHSSHWDSQTVKT